MHFGYNKTQANNQ